MAQGKYLSFEEARKTGKLDRFAREHEIPPEEQHPQARGRFERVLGLMCRGAGPRNSSEDGQT